MSDERTPEQQSEHAQLVEEISKRLQEQRDKRYPDPLRPVTPKPDQGRAKA